MTDCIMCIESSSLYAGSDIDCGNDKFKDCLDIIRKLSGVGKVVLSLNKLHAVIKSDFLLQLKISSDTGLIN